MFISNSFLHGTLLNIDILYLIKVTNFEPQNLVGKVHLYEGMKRINADKEKQIEEKTNLTANSRLQIKFHKNVQDMLNEKYLEEEEGAVWS